MRNYIPNLKNGSLPAAVKPIAKPSPKGNPTISTNNADKKEDMGQMITNPILKDLFNAAHSLTFEINNPTVWEKVKKGVLDAVKNNPFVSGVSVQCDRGTNPSYVIRNNLIGLRISYYDHYTNKRDSIDFSIPLKIDCD
jgi:hypothetical protein